MGYIRHHAIVVTGNEEDIIPAHQLAKVVFGDLVSNIVPSIINGYQSFFIAPDGSKEGWFYSGIGDENRDNFINNVENVSYAELYYGDDNRQSEVTRHN